MILRLSQSNDMLGAVAGASWMGQSNGLQQQLVDALNRLSTSGDIAPLKAYVETLHVTQKISDLEFDELMDALEKE